MLESLLSKLLTNYLSTYIKDLTAEKLRLGVWSGELVLTNLELRPDALDALELPVFLSTGRIARLMIKVPWSMLRTEPVKVLLEDVYLLVCLRKTADAAAQLRRERLRKRLALDAEELSRFSQAASGDSFLGRLAASVIDNVQLTLRRVHVRFEQQVSSPDRLLVCGATMESLELRTTDDAWQTHTTAQQRFDGWLYRLLSLSGLSLFLETAAHAQPAAAATCTQLEPAKESETGAVALAPPRRHVLAPVSATVRLRMLEANGEMRLRGSCNLSQDINVRLTIEQYQALLQMSVYFSQRALRERFARFRPSAAPEDAESGGTVSGSARARWAFASKCVLSCLGESRTSCSWAGMQPLLRRRRAYLQLWEPILRGETPSAMASASLSELEEELRLEEILLFRSIAKRRQQSAQRRTARGARSPSSSIPVVTSAPQLLSLLPSAARTVQTRESHAPREASSPSVTAEARTPSVPRWSGRFWQGPYSAALDASHAEADARARPGYAQLNLSTSQLQDLEGWAQNQMQERLGPSDSTSQRAAPSSTALSAARVRILAIRVQLVGPRASCVAFECADIRASFEQLPDGADACAFSARRIRLAHLPQPHDDESSSAAGATLMLQADDLTHPAVALKVRSTNSSLLAERTALSTQQQDIALTLRLSPITVSIALPAWQSVVDYVKVPPELAQQQPSSLLPKASRALPDVVADVKLERLTLLVPASRETGDKIEVALSVDAVHAKSLAPPDTLTPIASRALPALEVTVAGVEAWLRDGGEESVLVPTFAVRASASGELNGGVECFKVNVDAHAPQVLLSLRQLEALATLAAAMRAAAVPDAEATTTAAESVATAPTASVVVSTVATQSLALPPVDAAPAVLILLGVDRFLLHLSEFAFESSQLSVALSALELSVGAQNGSQHASLRIGALEHSLSLTDQAHLTFGGVILGINLSHDSPRAASSSLSPAPPQLPLQSSDASSAANEDFRSSHAGGASAMAGSAADALPCSVTRLRVGAIDWSASSSVGGPHARRAELQLTVSASSRADEAESVSDAVVGSVALGDGLRDVLSAVGACKLQGLGDLALLATMPAVFNAAAARATSDIESLSLKLGVAAAAPPASRPRGAADCEAATAVQASLAAIAVEVPMPPSKSGEPSGRLVLSQRSVSATLLLDRSGGLELYVSAAIARLSAENAGGAQGELLVSDTSAHLSVSDERRQAFVEIDGVRLALSHGSVLPLTLLVEQVMPQAEAQSAEGTDSVAQQGVSTQALDSASIEQQAEVPGEEKAEVAGEVTHKGRQEAREDEQEAGGAESVRVGGDVPVSVELILRSAEATIATDAGAVAGTRARHHAGAIGEGAGTPSHGAQALHLCAAGGRVGLRIGSRNTVALTCDEIRLLQEDTSSGGEPHCLLSFSAADSTNREAADAAPVNGGGGPTMTQSVRIDMVLEPGLMFVSMALPQVRVRASPSELGAAVLVVAPVAACLSGVAKMPEATDLPLVLDLALGDASVCLGTEAQGAKLEMSMQARLCTQGGVALSRRQTAEVLVPHLSFSWYVGRSVSVLLCPCQLHVRCRLNAAMVSISFASSSVQLQASLSELLFLEKLLSETGEAVTLAGSSAQPLLVRTPSIRRDRSMCAARASPQQAREGVSPPAILAASRSSSVSSEAEVYYDAEEGSLRSSSVLLPTSAGQTPSLLHKGADSMSTTLAEEGSQRTAESLSSSASFGESTARALHAEVSLGSLALTLLDSCDSRGAPLLQLMLQSSETPWRAYRPSPVSAFTATLALFASLYHFKQRRFAGGPQGWEPVLELCRLQLEVDEAQRSLTLGTSGSTELNLTPTMIRSFSNLPSQLQKAQETANGRSEVPRLDPCRVRNSTGTAARVWSEDETAAADISAGAEASMAAGQLPEVLCVRLEGFQLLELRAPYRDRYRLWPSDLVLLASPMLHLLVSTKIEDGSLLVELQTPVWLKNTTGVAFVVEIREKQNRTEPVSLELEAGHPTPVPLAYQCGLLSAEAPSRPKRRRRAQEQSQPLQKRQTALNGQAARSEVELGVAALQLLRGRSGTSLACGDDAQQSYLLRAERLRTGGNSWLMCFDAPLLLRNALLCDLEFELSDVASASASGRRCGTIHRHLAQGTHLPLFHTADGWYLRVRTGRFRWSHPVLISPPSQLPAGTHELKLRLPPQADGPGEAFAEAVSVGLDSALLLRLLVSVVDGRTEAEICGWLWIRNETHTDLQCEVAGWKCAPMLLPSCHGPSPLTDGQRQKPQGGPTATAAGAPPCVAVPILGQQVDSVEELCLRSVSTVESDVHFSGSPTMARRARGSRGATLALNDPLQPMDAAELLLPAELRTPCAEANGEAEKDAGKEAGAEALLSLRAQLSPLQHSLGTSLLLTVSPSLVLLNRTERPLHWRQLNASRSFELPPSGTAQPAGNSAAVYWSEPGKPRLLQLRRALRGSEWTGAVPIFGFGAGPLEDGAELMLRLRNLETSETEFVRLTSHRLESRATFVLAFSSETAQAAPIVVHNTTQHELQFQQAGVPILCTVGRGDKCFYSWDEPAGRKKLCLSVAALGVHFSCRAAPARIRRPLYAAVMRRPHLELSVLIEGARTRIVVAEVRPSAPFSVTRQLRSSMPSSHLSLAAAWQQRSPVMRPTMRALPEPRRRRSLPAVADSKGAQPLTWTLKLVVSEVGISLLDERPRELLFLSLRGLRITHVVGKQEELKLDAAIATMQLDCQLPSLPPSDQVLVRAGAAARADAMALQLACSTAEMPVLLHLARLAFQELDIRLNEAALMAVAAALLPSAGLEHGAAQREGQQAPLLEQLGLSLAHELQRIEQQEQASSKRIFVQALRLHPVKLKLSLQLSPRTTETAAPPPEATVHTALQPLTSTLLAVWRWLGSTVMSAEQVPFWLPEVTLQRVLLPYSGLVGEIRQRYDRALLRQAYKLLPSSVLFGDPYGFVRKLQKDWAQQLHELRRASWQQLPAALTTSASQLLNSIVADVLRAHGMSMLAVSKGVVALLPPEDQAVAATTGLPEALMRGVGGIARETACGAQWVTRTLERRTGPLPLALQSLATTLAIPFGLVRAAQRCSLLSILGLLSFARCSLEAFQTIVLGQSPPQRLGRAREPRAIAPGLTVVGHAATCNALLNRPQLRAEEHVEQSDILHCLRDTRDNGMLVLTRHSILFLDDAGAGTVRWRADLVEILLMLRQGGTLSLLCMARTPPSKSTLSGHAPQSDTGVLVKFDVRTSGIEVASDLHERVRIASLNARGLPFPLASVREALSLSRSSTPTVPLSSLCRVPTMKV